MLKPADFMLNKRLKIMMCCKNGQIRKEGRKKSHEFHSRPSPNPRELQNCVV
ncbi:unnamed protein product, partial [Nesidiocoris tenuis]